MNIAATEAPIDTNKTSPSISQIELKDNLSHNQRTLSIKNSVRIPIIKS